MMESRKVTIILLLALSIFTIPAFSQPKNGLGLDVALYNYYETGLHYSINYNWNIKRHLILSAGVSIFDHKLSAGWNTDSKTFYSIDDKNIRVNGILSPTFLLPVFKNIGIQASGTLMFEILPVNYIAIDKNNYNNDATTKPKGKYVFTQFNPGVFADAGLYYDLNKNDFKLRIMCSMGYGVYDPIRDYRRTTIDGQKLSNFVSEKKKTNRLNIKIIGYW